MKIRIRCKLPGLKTVLITGRNREDCYKIVSEWGNYHYTRLGLLWQEVMTAPFDFVSDNDPSGVMQDSDNIHMSPVSNDTEGVGMEAVTLIDGTTGRPFEPGQNKKSPGNIFD